MNRTERPRPCHLAAAEELEIALRTVSNFMASISNADTKAGLLIPALGVGVGGIYSQAPAIRASLAGHTPLGIAGLLLLAVLLCSVLAALVFLTATLIPRTTSPAGGPNLFAFPSFPHLRRATPRRFEGTPTIDLCSQAWEQAEVLASIAATKYRRLRTAMRWSCLALLAFLGWTAIMPFLTI
jgi:hypothetical protein